MTQGSMFGIKVTGKVNGAIYLCNGTRQSGSFSGKNAGAGSTNIDLTEVEYILVSVGLYSAGEQTSFIDKIMVCDETNQPYEPYTGGKSSPSSEYPQEIQSAGYVMSTGKNLVNIPTTESEWVKDIDITQIKNLPDGNYVLSAKVELKQISSNFKSTDICRIFGLDNNDNVIFNTLKTWGNDINNFLSAKIPFTVHLSDIKRIITYGCGNDRDGATGLANFYNFQLELGDTATSYEPYTGGVPALYQKDIEVGLSGKNLFNPDIILQGTYNKSNQTWSVYSNILEAFKVNFKKNTQYTFSAYVKQSNENLANVRFSIIYTDGTKNDVFLLNRSTKEIFVQETTEKNKTIQSVFFTFSENGTGYFRNLQIEEGTKVTEYEQYKSQSLPVTTPTGLPAIPVSSDTFGITYTDADGQAWIADEIDFERGKYIQRVWQAEFDGSDDEKWYKGNGQYIYNYCLPFKDLGRYGFSNKYAVSKIERSGNLKLGNNNEAMIVFDEFLSENALSKFKSSLAEHPLKVMTYLDTPIETDLSEEQIQAFKAVHANKPTTIIFNDANAWMDASYAADTKIWIENKIAKAIQDATTV